MDANRTYMIRIQPETYSQLKVLSQEQDRSISSMANVLLKQALVNNSINEPYINGIDPKPGPRGYEKMYRSQPEPVVVPFEETT